MSVKRTSRWRGVTPAAAQSCACTLENYLTAEKEPNGLFRFASALKSFLLEEFEAPEISRGSALVSAVSEALFKWEALSHRKGSESDSEYI